MINVKEDTTIVGIAELRTKASDVLKEIKKNRVILTKRNRPVGIIVDYDEFERIQKFIDIAEDIILGEIDRERSARRDKNVLTLEESEKKVGLR